MTQSLQHLTLDTGDLKLPALDAIDPAALGITEAWLRELLGAGKVGRPIPGYGDAGYTASAVRAGDCLLTSAFGPRGEPLVTFAVAPRPSTDTVELWALISEGYKGVSEPLHPWCAVRLYPTLALAPAALRWIGDYELCVAAAWLRICPTPSSGSFNPRSATGGPTGAR